MSDYKLPSQGQILYHWNVKPLAKVIALVIRDFAEKQMEDNPTASKVTIAANKLSKITNGSEVGIDSALDELQAKGLAESNRPKPEDRKKSTKSRARRPYYYRLHNVRNKDSWKDLKKRKKTFAIAAY